MSSPTKNDFYHGSAYEIPSANTTESKTSHQATNFNFSHSKKFSLHATHDLSNKCSVCPNILGQGIGPYTSSQFIDAATSSNNTGKLHSLNDTTNTSYHLQAMGSQFWPEQVESKHNPYPQSPAPFCGNRSPILSLQNRSEDPFSRDLYSITRYLNEGHSERYALLDRLDTGGRSGHDGCCYVAFVVGEYYYAGCNSPT